MLDALHAAAAFLAALGVSPGELLSIGSVWAAVGVLRKRLATLEAMHVACPHAAAYLESTSQTPRP